MRLGLALGYWGRGPSPDHVALAQEAERLGYDSVWTAESWGSDVFTPLAWIAAHTSRIRLGTAVAQMAARSPTTTAMHALTLDHLSGGRMMLGLGLSGPQVVEGWYGRPFPSSPLTATREYVDVVRQVLRREAPVELAGRFHSHPYRGPDATGLGKPLKPITHPLRPDLPILLGAEGRRTSPRRPGSPTAGCRCTGRRPGRRSTAPPCANSPRTSSSHPWPRPGSATTSAEGLLPVKAMLGLYIGGMGHAARNFHADLMARHGYEEEARRIQELFLSGRREEAVLACRPRGRVNASRPVAEGPSVLALAPPAHPARARRARLPVSGGITRRSRSPPASPRGCPRASRSSCRGSGP
ncbi:F420-dependent oxidoreductase-like protein OS=Streptomyces violarus OX=67380 GN=FHS41_003221 PE=4 SV=1 [Streptomyces violarus]